MASPPAAAPVAAGGGSSVVKIVLIIFGVLALLGALSAAGLLYLGYKAKQKIEQVAKEEGFDLDSSRRAPARPAGDGCRHLSAADASAIVGVKIVRAESKPPEGCNYFADPDEAAKLAQSRAQEGMNEIESGKPDKEGFDQALKTMEKVMGGITGTAGGEAAQGRLFGFDIKGDGKNSWAGFQLSSKVVGGISGESEMRKEGVKLFEPVEGLGDKAMFLPMGIGLCVLKGDAFISFTFTGAVSREQRLEIAHKVIASL